jgi:cytochrome c peroxidase
MIQKNFFAPLCLLFCVLIMVSCAEEDNSTIIVEDEQEESTITPEPGFTDQELIASYLLIDINEFDDYVTVDFPTYYTPNVLDNDNTPANNPVTNEGATLGRVLFYDKQLSLNNTVSCASCHSQSTGFTDVNQFSEGFAGGLTGAHSMRLANANFYTGDNMFWDKRAATLEEQVIMPVQDHIEMGFDAEAGGMDSLIRRLEMLDYYPILFDRAFKSEEITAERIQLALAQFIRSMVSVNSKFDDGYAEVFVPGPGGGSINASFPNFTAAENLGKALFLLPPNQGGAGCAACHQPPTFALDNNSRSNGLDQGEDIVFKSPSLKNLGLAGGYMHDGRFETLEEVVAHYNDGIQPGPALDNRLRNPQGQPVRLNLTPQEQEALVAFLNTLDDLAIISDQRFADPFK